MLSTELFSLLFTLILHNLPDGSNLTIIFCNVLKDCGKTFEYEFSTRIVGGSVLTNEKSHPFMVHVQIMKSKDVCGGTIISDRYVLTAAHCVYERHTHEIELLVGLHDLAERGKQVKKYNVDKIIMYEQFFWFLDEYPYNDIALLRTTEQIEFNDYVQPICLPFHIDVTKHKAGKVMGWGNTNPYGAPSRALRAALLSIIDNKACSRSYWKTKKPNIPFQTIMCAYRQKSGECEGDSGGPLIVRDENDTQYQIGIASFRQVCARYGWPGIYTRIATFLPWIKKHVGGSFCPP